MGGVTQVNAQHSRDMPPGVFAMAARREGEFVSEMPASRALVRLRPRQCNNGLTEASLSTQPAGRLLGGRLLALGTDGLLIDARPGSPHGSNRQPGSDSRRRADLNQGPVAYRSS
jgi:hypothetical protein